MMKLSTKILAWLLAMWGMAGIAVAQGSATNQAKATGDAFSASLTNEVAQAAAAGDAVVAPAAATGAVENIRAIPRRLKDYNLPGMDTVVNLKTLEGLDSGMQLIEVLCHYGKVENVVFSRGVAAVPAPKVKFGNIPVGDALDAVLSLNKLAFEVKDGIVSIMTDDEYRLQHGVSFYDQKQVRVVDLKYADPSRVEKLLAPIKSEGGTLISDQVAGTLVLIDTPEKMQEMLSIIDRADIPRDTKAFVLQYAEVESIQKEVENLLSKEVGSVRGDKRTKTLIVSDYAHNLKRISDLIALFDRRPRQVFIEAKIMEVSLSDGYSLGVDWSRLMKKVGDYNVQLISSPIPKVKDLPIFPTYGTVQYTKGTSGEDGFMTALVTAMKQIGDTKILSNPQITAMDGEEAKLDVIVDQPYKKIGLEAGTTNMTTVNYEFVKVGVTLSVTPRINEENMISMSIKPEVSVIESWYDGTEQEGTPVVKRSIAATKVMVRDGVTIIIGGLIQDGKATSKRSVPILGSIPLLGALFSFTDESATKKETVIFLTPRIVTGEEPYLRMRDMKKSTKPLRAVGAAEEKSMKAIR